MPQAPSRDLRGPAVWSPIYHISPAATKRQTPSIQHHVGFTAHITSIDPITRPLKPCASQIAVRLSLSVEKIKNNMTRGEKRGLATWQICSDIYQC